MGHANFKPRFCHAALKRRLHPTFQSTRKERGQAVFGGVDKFIESIAGKIKKEAEMPKSRLNKRSIYGRYC